MNLPLLLLLLLAGSSPTSAAQVELLRVPDDGLQPQAAVDSRGVLHLIYFKGEPRAGDVFYTRRAPGDTAFSLSLRVNSLPNTAIAIGTVRGPHLAIGRNGRPHVTWMNAGEGHSGMYYTRLDDQGTAFEPQRNLTQEATGLDGGGSIAADALGNVYVAWHAGYQAEAQRGVWFAPSADDGQTFAREIRADSGETGVCGCCGMRAFADRSGYLYLLYRAATENIHRDMYLLSYNAQGELSGHRLLHEWELAACPMSTAYLSETPSGVLAAWETDGQVYYARPESFSPVPAPGKGQSRKHPVVAGNQQGEVLLAWTEGTGWNQGGSLAWQVYDPQGRPLGEKGFLENAVPVWGCAAALAGPGGKFTLIY
jgi:hypothetical protein